MSQAAVPVTPGWALRAAPSLAGASTPARKRRDTMRNTWVPTVHACGKKGTNRPSQRWGKHGNVGLRAPACGLFGGDGHGLGVAGGRRHRDHGLLVHDRPEDRDLQEEVVFSRARTQARKYSG